MTMQELSTLKNKSLFFKDKSGITWFLGVYSNNFEDRQGEILSEKSHQEYVDWANKMGIKLPVILLHQPKFPDIVHLANFVALVSRKITADTFNDNLLKMYKPTAIAQSQAVWYKNGFVFVLGKVFPERIKLVEKLSEQISKWGMSHGFIPLIKRDNIIQQYRTFEFTVCPLSLSANELTAIGFKEVKMGDVLDTLPEEAKELLNEDTLEHRTKVAQELLVSLLASKALDETPVVEKQEDESSTEEEKKDEEEESSEVQYATLRQNLYADFKMDELVTVLKAIGDKLVEQDSLIAKQAAAMEAMSKTLTELSKSEDQRIAEQFQSPNWIPGFVRKSNEPTEEEQKKIEELKKNIPERVVEKTEQTQENPINQLFWGPLFGGQQ